MTAILILWCYIRFKSKKRLPQKRENKVSLKVELSIISLIPVKMFKNRIETVKANMGLRGVGGLFQSIQSQILETIGKMTLRNHQNTKLCTI